MTLEVLQFPCLEDNYGYLVHDQNSGATATIDSPDADKIITVLKEKNWDLTHILNTHHHWDHTDGNTLLKEHFNCQVIGPYGEKNKIPAIDLAVQQDDVIDFSGHEIRVIETPGHTLGHIIYYLADQKIAFVGDTIFSMGCGRLFEGTADQMWHSLEKVMQFPDETKLYCAHEYTQANAEFALSIEPGNNDLISRCEEVKQLRQNNQPTIPTSVCLEKKTNPFLRAASDEIRQKQAMQEATDAEVFARVRRLKDNF